MNGYIYCYTCNVKCEWNHLIEIFKWFCIVKRAENMVSTDFHQQNINWIFSPIKSSLRHRIDNCSTNCAWNYSVAEYLIPLREFSIKNKTKNKFQNVNEIIWRSWYLKIKLLLSEFAPIFINHFPRLMEHSLLFCLHSIHITHQHQNKDILSALLRASYNTNSIDLLSFLFLLSTIWNHTLFHLI